MKVFHERISPDTIILQTRIPEGHRIDALEYAGKIEVGEGKPSGYFVRPKGATVWGLAFAAEVGNEYSAEKQGESVEEGIVRQIRQEPQTYIDTATPNGHSRLVHIKDATVIFVRVKQLGILVPGGYIITAAEGFSPESGSRCVVRTTNAEVIHTYSGETVSAGLIYIDFINDIAVFGASKARGRYNRFCSLTKPVRLCCDSYGCRQSIDIHLLSDQETWLSATAQIRHLSDQRLVIKMRKRPAIRMAGGPIVDDTGRLVGIVSRLSGNAMPQLHLNLPGWLLKQTVGFPLQNRLVTGGYR